MDKKQAQMRQQITMMLCKKDYYDVLGIQKSATQTQIKKSYKKLALRFHPDKNNTEGSKQVFKKVSQAYSVLINKQQKQRYDKYGPEEQIQARFRQQNRHNHNHHNQDYQFQQFDDIFRAFFGMNGMQMNNRAGFRTYTFNMGGQHYYNNPNNNQQQQRGFNFSYFFVIIFFLYVIAPLLKSPSYYSMNASSQYRFRTTTDKLSTPYFVREGFQQQVRKDSQFKSQIDFQVDVLYFNSLRKDCDIAIQQKKKYQYMAYQYQGEQKDNYLKKAKNISQASCEKLKRMAEDNPEYVSQIYYYR